MEEVEELSFGQGWSFPRNEEAVHRTGIMTISKPCGCEIVYREVGAMGCGEHRMEDPVWSTKEFGED